MGRRVEHRHHTDAQVTDALEKALALVAEMDVPEDLRQIAFSKAIDLFTAKQIVVEQVQPGILGGIPLQGH